MGVPVLIMGKSGSGKSTSLRNFSDADNIGIINVLGKPLPFKNSLKSINTDNYDEVASVLSRAKSKTIVIDDAGYLMTNQFMRGHAKSGTGNGIFSFYNEIGDRFWALIEHVIHNLDAQKIVYFMMHEDKNDFGDIKPKSIGKMLDEKVCIEGMFTIALRCKEHKFYTQTDGTDVAKTPIGMFETMEIDNDLKAVDTAIREYYRLNESEDN